MTTAMDGDDGAADGIEAFIERELGRGDFISFDRFAPPSAEDSGQSNAIAASFLRRLLVESQDAIHYRGLMLEGFAVKGQFELSGCEVKRRLIFRGCSFDAPIALNDAVIAGLWLEGGELAGLSGHRLTVKGTLAIRKRARSRAAIVLREAAIAKSIVLSSAELWSEPLPEAKEGVEQSFAPSLDLSGAVVGGHCTFVGGTKVYGSVDLYGARIDGNLEVVGSSLFGSAIALEEAVGVQERHAYALDLTSATIRGGLIVARDAYIGRGFRCYGASLGALEIVDAIVGASDMPDEMPTMAVDARLCRVRDAVIVGDGAFLNGHVSFGQASTAMLHVDFSRWPEGRTHLDGFTYDRFAASGRFWDNDTVAWLDRDANAKGPVFHPQPWERAAAVLSAMGHESEARRVRIAKARRSARASRAEVLQRLGRPADWRGWLERREWRRLARVPPDALLWACQVVWHGFLEATIAYGHQPLRSILLLLGLIAAGYGVYGAAADLLVPVGAQPPPFSPLVYAVELAVPIFGFDLAASWRPAADSLWLWRFHYAYQVAGWILGGFAVAGFTGLVRK